MAECENPSQNRPSRRLHCQFWCRQPPPVSEPVLLMVSLSYESPQPSCSSRCGGPYLSIPFPLLFHLLLEISKFFHDQFEMHKGSILAEDNK